ncbi:hypothetical protein ACFQY7_21220 [Actinomadura luteofluorescens]|uniref:hypothetical protein n=1 Tax=Actinomadura luteofluorescens TaxID=46163 RepID=UPI00363583C0
MIPSPLTCTVMSSGTMISNPPMIASARITTWPSSNRASRRSILPPPQKANARNRRGTFHTPARRNPLMIPMPLRQDGAPCTGRQSAPVAGGAARPGEGRSRVIGSSSA